MSIYTGSIYPAAQQTTLLAADLNHDGIIESNEIFAVRTPQPLATVSYGQAPSTFSYGALGTTYPMATRAAPATYTMGSTYGAPVSTISYGAPTSYATTAMPYGMTSTALPAPTIPATSYSVNVGGGSLYPPLNFGGSMQVPQDKTHTSDWVLNRDESKLDEMANTVGTATGMEHQIEELVEFQREFKREIEQIKAEINHNFATLEDLKKIAQYARTHHVSKIEAERVMAHQAMQRAAAAPKAKPLPPSNLGAPLDFGAVHGHVRGHAERVGRAAGGAFDTMHGMYRSRMGGPGGAPPGPGQ